MTGCCFRASARNSTGGSRRRWQRTSPTAWQTNRKCSPITLRTPALKGQQPRLDWWGEAGKLATHRVALREATAHFRQGLSLVETVQASAERDRLELGIREPFNGALTALSGWAAAEVGDNAAAILELTERQEHRRPGAPAYGRCG